MCVSKTILICSLLFLNCFLIINCQTKTKSQGHTKENAKEQTIDRSLKDLVPYGLDLSTHRSNSSYVLVLGSGGLIGKNLVPALRKANYSVLEVTGRDHLDLRVENALTIFDNLEISMVYFLACEVGGSKFLSKKENSDIILKHNRQIHDCTFDYLEKRNLPFIFSSSSMVDDPSAYGTIKHEAEETISKLENGRIVRFWNVYGVEPIGLKTHVVPDWVQNCLLSINIPIVNSLLGSLPKLDEPALIHSLTDGNEKRQYLHTNDTVNGLILMMKHFNSIDFPVDLGTGVWSDLRQLGQVLLNVSDNRCGVKFNEIKATERIIREPVLDTWFHRNYWLKEDFLSLDQGMKIVFNKMSKSFLINRTSKYRAILTVSLILIVFTIRLFF
ncbi:udp-glucose 4-epimerase [Anaeramoeba flamelloides]|uniref:Udp-glucose 4-epimerase n=1 Tax=Anaeramoeba flamelloides TaxID=1746091 RepID=A0AAV7Z3X5_9EUKA|nr:udp-glucose 4-epimerase [Anaeramoeba flamelloides]